MPQIIIWRNAKFGFIGSQQLEPSAMDKYQDRITQGDANDIVKIINIDDECGVTVLTVKDSNNGNDDSLIDDTNSNNSNNNNDDDD
jgi:hypothetical protein